jgi:imidazolonepropionase-like amidohydrolase
MEEGAYTDILLVDGNPLEDLKILTDYDNSLLLIVKDGKVYKNNIK